MTDNLNYSKMTIFVTFHSFRSPVTMVLQCEDVTSVVGDLVPLCVMPRNAFDLEIVAQIGPEKLSRACQLMEPYLAEW